VTDWTVVVPVKGTPSGKSRLGGDAAARRALAESIALDTVEAALVVAPVLVVTSPASAAAFEGLGARVLIDPGGGLDAAVAAGVATSSGAVAVLLGDLPALAPRELADALALAAPHPLSFVPDADGTGTVLVAGRAGGPLATAFGAGSRAAHAALGYAELELPPASGLRRDVDTVGQLLALPLDRLGRRTAALVSAL